MPDRLPEQLRTLADLQRGILTRRQALSASLTDDLIESWANRGRWRRLRNGVYATFTGPPDRKATLWAAVLLGGPGAALSYQSAAELDALLDRPAPVIHVTVPLSRRVAPRPGIVVHSRRRADPPFIRPGYPAHQDRGDCARSRRPVPGLRRRHRLGHDRPRAPAHHPAQAP